jgi:hypothetical protein
MKLPRSIHMQDGSDRGTHLISRLVTGPLLLASNFLPTWHSTDTSPFSQVGRTASPALSCLHRSLKPRYPIAPWDWPPGSKRGLRLSQLVRHSSRLSISLAARHSLRPPHSTQPFSIRGKLSLNSTNRRSRATNSLSTAFNSQVILSPGISNLCTSSKTISLRHSSGSSLRALSRLKPINKDRSLSSKSAHPEDSTIKASRPSFIIS